MRWRVAMGECRCNQNIQLIACYDVFGLSACKLLDMQTSNTVWQTFTYQTQTNKRIRCNRLSCPLRAHSIGFVSVIRCIGTCASYRNTSPRVFGYSFRYSGIRVFGFSGFRVFGYSGIQAFGYSGIWEKLNRLNWINWIWKRLSLHVKISS